MSNKNDFQPFFYTFGLVILIVCGYQIAYKCIFNRTNIRSEDPILEMDTITNILHANDYERFSILPDMTKFINNEECSICTDVLSEKQIRILKCSHQFHQTCIDEWFTKSGHFECPICGLDISQVDDCQA